MLNATFEIFVLHYIMVICVVSVPNVSSQKGEFIIFGCTRLLHVCLMALVLEESILLVTLVHVLINIYDKIK